jgi:hypothetical protein
VNALVASLAELDSECAATLVELNQERVLRVTQTEMLSGQIHELSDQRMVECQLYQEQKAALAHEVVAVREELDQERNLRLSQTATLTGQRNKLSDKLSVECQLYRDQKAGLVYDLAAAKASIAKIQQEHDVEVQELRRSAAAVVEGNEREREKEREREREKKREMEKEEKEQIHRLLPADRDRWQQANISRQVARAEQVEAELLAKLALLTATLEEERATAAEDKQTLIRQLALSQQGGEEGTSMRNATLATSPQLTEAEQQEATLSNLWMQIAD